MPYKPPDGPEKYRDKEWLQEQYHGQQLSANDISNKCDCSKSTILRWLDKHNIDKRDKSEAAKIRAERYPHTTQNYPEEFRETSAWELWDEEEREEFREWLSEERTGEKNPMWNVTGEDHHNYKPDKKRGRFYMTKEWRKVRREALKQADHKCAVCGTQEQLVGHHIIPLSKGGEPHDVDNVAILCRSCHMEWEGLYLRPDTRGESDE